jgi:hypothetical protein
MDVDVFDYSFRLDATDKKPVLRKLAVYQAHQSVENLPPYVRKVAADARKAKTR